MKSSYNPSILIPKVEKKDDQEIHITHSHGCSATYRNYEPYNLSDRKAANKFFSNEIKRTENCIKFFKDYEKALPQTTSPEIRASISATIRTDEEYMEQLSSITPSACVVL